MRRGFFQAGFEFFPLGEEVPEEVAVHFAHGVGEAVLFFQQQFAIGK